MVSIHIGPGPQLAPAPSKRRWPLYAAAAAVVLVLSAAAAAVSASILTAGRDSARPTASASSPPAAAVRLDSPQAIAQRLADLGAPCGPLEPLSNPLGATARASCYVNGDDEVVISTYASHDGAEAQWQFMSTTLVGISDLDMVIGDIWTISGDDPAYVKHAADLLGGAYRHQGA